jgi:hypothetical protein
VESIEAQLVEYIGGYQNTACHTDSQAKDIDEGKSLVFFEIDKGNFQIVLKHFDLLTRKSAINMPSFSTGVIPFLKHKKLFENG